MLIEMKGDENDKWTELLHPEVAQVLQGKLSGFGKLFSMTFSMRMISW